MSPQRLTKPERHLIRRSVREAARESFALRLIDLSELQCQAARAEMRKRGFRHQAHLSGDIWLFAGRHRGLELA